LQDKQVTLITRHPFVNNVKKSCFFAVMNSPLMSSVFHPPANGNKHEIQDVKRQTNKLCNSRSCFVNAVKNDRAVICSAARRKHKRIQLMSEIFHPRGKCNVSCRTMPPRTLCFRGRLHTGGLRTFPCLSQRLWLSRSENTRKRLKCLFSNSHLSAIHVHLDN
jgi:hypothetical protein